MTLDEWEPISRMLFSAFPQGSSTTEQKGATVLVYFADLREFDEVDVAGACEYLRTSTGPFLPSIAAIRAQVMVEREARWTRESLPDFTRFDELPEAEQERRLDRGLRSSRIGPAPDAPEDKPDPEFLREKIEAMKRELQGETA